MEALVKSLSKYISFVCLLTTCFSGPLLAVVYPLEEWAKRADIRNVELSPDGEKLALLRIASTEGMPILEVYNLSLIHI